MTEQLLKKLRYKDGKALILNAPDGYQLGIETVEKLEGKHEFLQLFTNNAHELDEWLPKVIPLLNDDAVFWITYPKKSPKSKVTLDINRDILAKMVQDQTAYRAVSNVAIDEKWSALRFRLKDKVKTRESTALPDIRQTSILNAPIQKVWKAISTSEGIAAWFMPNDFQPIVGFEFHLNAGPYGMSPCKVTEVDPPNRVSFHWGKDWTLTFELVEQDNKTVFTLIHSGWDANGVTEFGENQSIVRDRMDQGWVGLCKKLGEYVEA